MVSIPRISEFVEVMDSKAKAFHHILETRIRHDMNNVIKPMFVSVVTGLFVGLMNYIGLRKLLSFNKSQGLFYQI